MFQSFEQQRFQNDWWSLLVVSQSWQILFSTLESFENLGAPKGTILKNRINHLIKLVQTIGHKTPSLETFFLNSSKIRQWKNDEFWKKLIFGNLVCIKTCYGFKLAKTLPMTQKKKQVSKIMIFWDHLDWCLGACWPKLLISREHFWATILSLDRNDINNLGPKCHPFQNNPYMRRDASTWRAMFGVHHCPE